MKMMKKSSMSAALSRERCPSKIRSMSTTDASIEKGTSRRMVTGDMVMGAMAAAHPAMRRVLKMFEPMTFPTARSLVPLSADMKLTQNSGIEVPMATMVSPMTTCETCARSAMATAPSVRKSAPRKTM